MKAKTRLSALALAIAISACAGQQKPPTPAPTEEVEDVTPEAVKVETSKLHGLNHQQRVDFMKTEIMPKMTPVFQGFDATHFAKVTCVTCHGPGVKEGKFDMPTAALPRLDFASKDPKHEKWNAFMRGQVVPTMAGALGVKPYDKATKTGFGCLSCHLKAEK